MQSRKTLVLGVVIAACVALSGGIWALFYCRARWRKEKNHSYSLREQETLVLRGLAEAALLHLDAESRGAFPASLEALMEGVPEELTRAMDILEGEIGTPRYWVSPSGKECGIAYPSEDGVFDIESLEMMRDVAKGKEPRLVLQVLYGDKWNRHLFNRADVFVYMEANRLCYLNSVVDFSSSKRVGSGIQVLRRETREGAMVWERAEADVP